MPAPAPRSNIVRPEKIYITEEFECRFWSRKLHTTPERLMEVVAKVGPYVADVRRELEGEERGAQR